MMIMENKVGISRIFFQTETGAQGSQAVPVRAVTMEERLLLGSIGSALSFAGLTRPDIEGAGVIVGVDSAIDKVKESYFNGVVQDGPLGASPLLFPYTSPNALAARATIHFGIKGPDITIASGPLSFLKAVIYAYRLVSSGRLRHALAAGVTEGVSATICLGLEPSDLSISSVSESRGDRTAGHGAVASMIDTVSIFNEALSAGQCALAEAYDPSGNTVSIRVAFEKRAGVKEEAFA